MGILLPAIMVVLSAWSWAADPCLDAFQVEEHQAKWEILPAAWATLCRDQPDPKKNLANVKEKFIEACLEKAMPSIQESYLLDQARTLCAEGVPGREYLSATGSPGRGSEDASGYLTAVTNPAQPARRLLRRACHNLSIPDRE